MSRDHGVRTKSGNHLNLNSVTNEGDLVTLNRKITQRKVIGELIRQQLMYVDVLHHHNVFHM